MITRQAIRPSGESALGNLSISALLRPSALWAAGLFLMLCFATATVFVKQAWALQTFQIGIYALVAAYLLSSLRRSALPVAGSALEWLIYVLPLWGLLQISIHTTASSFETRGEVLRWGSLAGVFFLTRAVTVSANARRIFLSFFLGFATVMAVLCLTQLFTSEGKVLWIFPTGYPDVYATFPYHANYTQFLELSLPIALWRALQQGWRSWWYPLSGGVLYASAVGSASRGGAFICTVEMVVMLAYWLLILRRASRSVRTRTAILTLALIPVVAAVFTVAVGWQNVWNRFQDKDPFSGRREFLIAAVKMAEHRPLAGFGLGTFPEVYQRFAVKDFPFYANHTHNDWAEFAADGGIPFLLLVLIPFAAAIPTALRHPWGIGLIAVMAHACFDYPFPRPAVSGWIFALLAVLYATRAADRGAEQAPRPAPVAVLSRA